MVNGQRDYVTFSDHWRLIQAQSSYLHLPPHQLLLRVRDPIFTVFSSLLSPLSYLLSSLSPIRQHLLMCDPIFTVFYYLPSSLLSPIRQHLLMGDPIFTVFSSLISPISSVLSHIIQHLLMGDSIFTAFYYLPSYIISHIKQHLCAFIICAIYVTHA